MRPIYTLLICALPLSAVAMPMVNPEGETLQLIEIKVPPQDIERCQATLAMVMLRDEFPEGGLIAETDTGPARFQCVAE